ncbi:hypothetical protein EPUL_005669, partial [Erysiphe pulchra]
MSGSEQKLTYATLFDCLYEVPGNIYSDSTSTLELREDLERIDSSVKGKRREEMSSIQPSGSMESNSATQFAGLIPSDLKDSVIRFTGNNKSSTTIFRQINTCFECAGIEFTPRRFFNVIILRVGGDALEVLEQNWRLVECLNDISVVTSDDMETKKDWMEDLAGLKQESTESLESYQNRAAIILKNLDLVDGAKNCSMAEKHLLSTICMAYYTGLHDIALKRRILQVRGWSNCASLLEIHTLALDEKKDMEQQEQVEQQIKDAECIQMMQELRSGTISHNDFNTFLSSLGSTSSFSTKTSMPPSIVNDASRFRPNRSKIDSGRTRYSPFVSDTMESNMFHLNTHSDECTEVPHIKSDVLMGGLNKVDADVSGYEPAGQKRVRMDDESENDSDRTRRAAEANDRERRERHRHQKNIKGKENVVLSTSNHEKKRGDSKLRTIVGREGKGPLDYKRMLENTTITMSMMDFYQASPDFSKSCRTLSTRINEKRIKRKKYSEREPETIFEEEILMAETSGSLAKMHIDNG